MDRIPRAAQADPKPNVNTRAAILDTLAKAGGAPVRMGKLADRAGISGEGARLVVVGLERDGLAARDGKRGVTLTEVGRTLPGVVAVRADQASAEVPIHDAEVARLKAEVETAKLREEQASALAAEAINRATAARAAAAENATRRRDDLDAMRAERLRRREWLHDLTPAQLASGLESGRIHPDELTAVEARRATDHRRLLSAPQAPRRLGPGSRTGGGYERRPMSMLDVLLVGGTSYLAQKIAQRNATTQPSPPRSPHSPVPVVFGGAVHPNVTKVDDFRDFRLAQIQPQSMWVCEHGYAAGACYLGCA